jgi:hypothetical protein
MIDLASYCPRIPDSYPQEPRLTPSTRVPSSARQVARERATAPPPGAARSRWRSSTTSSPSTSPENQILRTARERMFTVPRVDAESQRTLRRLLRGFADVTPLSRGDSIPAWRATRLNSRYHTALRLAELVLYATSVEHEFWEEWPSTASCSTCPRCSNTSLSGRADRRDSASAWGTVYVASICIRRQRLAFAS